MPDAAAPLAIPGEALAAWRAQLRDGREALKHGFLARPDTTRLLRGHARLVDAVIREVWVAAGCPARAALVAVGGYGRGQLYPHSDVDLLILLPESGESDGAPIERFLAALWDVGIEVGHSARSVRQCLSEMAADATIRTSLLEHRHLAGDRALYREYSKAYAAAMDARDFYDAKTLEQQQRHLKYHDAAYNLEPNLKESPGGLRDLQTVVWIARAAGLGRSWSELARAGLMTAVEARSIARQERLIGALRARLHYLAGRREDRLVFDLQTALAREIGLADTPTRRASELLMQRYYRAAKTVRQVNTILLQNLHARLFPIPRDPVPISDDYCAIDELLHVASEDLYDRKPSAMLDAFLLMERHPELKGMSARTLRALWRWRHRIDARFRRDHGNRERFVALFREPRGITHELRRMNLYGILGAYLPAFGRIVGQMQHDLFHVYTVDEHILMVIRNLRRFTEPQHAHEYPLCSRLIADLPRKDVLYLAGLFHDIAKGRGGDHSALGARDARRFCREHGLPPADADDVAWLVEHHLTMSATAQKQDLSDPEVVAAFAAKVGREERLVLLYLLTVADIRGTSPRVWNAWKAQLLEDLFHATRRVLGGGDAKRTLLVKQFTLTEPTLVEAVIAAHRRGVDVRVMLNPHRSSGDRANDETHAALRKAGVPVEWTNPHFAVTHEKSVVIDGELALISTFNLATKYFTQTRDYGIVTNEPQHVAEIVECFDADWKRQHFAPNDGSGLAWSADNSRHLMARFIDDAKHRLDIQHPKFVDATILDRIAEAQHRGVHVRLLCGGKHGISAWDIPDTFSSLRILDRAGVKVHRQKHLKLHAKLIIADEKRALIGSMNIDRSAFDLRRELGIFLDDEKTVERLAEVFERDWDEGHRYEPPDPLDLETHEEGELPHDPDFHHD